MDVYELHVIPEQVEDFRVLITRVKQILNLSDKNVDKIFKTKKNKNHGKQLLFQTICLGMSFQK